MSNKKPNLRKNMVAMVTIAFVLSKFVSAYGQANLERTKGEISINREQPP